MQGNITPAQFVKSERTNSQLEGPDCEIFLQMAHRLTIMEPIWGRARCGRSWRTSCNPLL